MKLLYALSLAVQTFISLSYHGHIVQKFRGTKLSQLDHHVSIHRKAFMFESV